MVMKKTMSKLKRNIDVRSGSILGFSTQQWVPHSANGS